MTSGGVKDACCSVESWNNDGVAVETGDVSSLLYFWTRSSKFPLLLIPLRLFGARDHFLLISQEYTLAPIQYVCTESFCRLLNMICSCSTTHVLVTNAKSFPSFLAFCKTFIKVLLRFGLNLKEDKRKLFEKVVTLSEMK